MRERLYNTHNWNINREAVPAFSPVLPRSSYAGYASSSRTQPWQGCAFRCQLVPGVASQRRAGGHQPLHGCAGISSADLL